METSKIIAFTQELVQRQSLSGDEEAVAIRVRDEMQMLNFDQVSVDENGSVIGIVEGKQPGKTLLFDAHTDTVGISPGVPWEHDPFGAKIVDNAIVGRGSVDMKGALAAMVYAASNIEREKLHGRVVVSASTMEEVLEGICLKSVMDAMDPDFVVIGEATGLNIARGGRGRAEIHLETVGKPSHSSAPQLGLNAVLEMTRVINAIEDLWLPEHALMGPAILALTDIISDPYPGHSVIPSICRATYDRRLLPGETRVDVLDAITSLPDLQDMQLRAIIATGKYEAYTGQMLICEKFFPAWLYPEEDGFVQKALQGLNRVGLAPSTRAYRFCTNAAYSAGVAGVPTIGFGPGDEQDAHIINERLQIDDLVATARGYESIMQELLF